MAGFFNKLFGSNDDYDDYDDYYDELEGNYDERDLGGEDYTYNDPVIQAPSDRNRQSGSRVVDINEKKYKQQIVIMEPSDIETAQEVCDNVRSGKTVICNIEKIDPKIAQRVIDFITGAAYALRGNVMPISALIFVVAPGSTNIVSSIEEEQETSETVEDYVRRAAFQAR